MALSTWITGGGGFRLTPTGQQRQDTPIPVVTLAPKCPVISIDQLRAARARRLERGQRRPGGSAA